MVCLGQLQLHAKFEVTGYSHYVDIEGNLQNLGSSLYHAPFTSACDFMLVLGNPSGAPNLKPLASAVAEIL